MSTTGFVYIMTNKNKTNLYIGVTNNLCRRIHEHKNHLINDTFTDKYNIEYCIYYEEFQYFELAIQREKELKKWNRQKFISSDARKLKINKKNPEWKVLVTERGFVRNNKSFSQHVSDIVNELQPIKEIPPCGRNDDQQNCGVAGGEESAALPHSLHLPLSDQ